MTYQTLIAEAHNQQRTLTAIVEQDARTAYFYIWPTDLFRSQFAVRGCWLRNLLPAPVEDDHQAMAQGIAPLLSAEYCRNLEAEPPLDPAGLQILWEPGDACAALWYYGQLLAVIPGWSLYQDKQVSFSAGCIKNNRLTAPLGSASTNHYYALAEQQRQFWREWHDGSEWDKVQQDLMTCYQAQFGESVKYYAIDQGNWPPMALSQHYHNGIWYFLTLGMSIRPMPQVDFLFDELAPHYRRAELGMAVDGEVMTESNAVQMASALAEFVHLPWARLTWLGEGHTLASEVAPVGFESYLLANELAPESAQFVLPRRDGDRPTLLWATPVTEAERQFAQAEPQGGQQLRERLSAGGNTHIFRPREQVVEAG